MPQQQTCHTAAEASAAYMPAAEAIMVIFLGGKKWPMALRPQLTHLSKGFRGLGVAASLPHQCS
jgi:hypothetical protein